MEGNAIVASSLSLAINGWRMQGLRTGVRRYLYNVVRHWTPEVAGDFETIRLYSALPLDDDVTLPASIESVVLRSRLPMIPWENFRLGPRARERVLFGPSHSIPFRPHDRTVVVIHDALLRLHPERFPWQARLFHDRIYEWSGRNSTLVITDSNAAATDIASAYGVPREKIRVIQLAPDDIFRSARPVAGPRIRGEDSTPEQPYVLFVGKMSGRRDIPTLIESFAEFVRACLAPHRLVLAGKNVHGLELQSQIARLGIEDRIVLIDGASDLELRELYSGAELFVSPAVYETVSLPVLEAQAMGVPVVCIGSSGMREVAGGAAHYVERMGIGELSRAMGELWRNPDRRTDLSVRGLAHTKQLTWERCSLETLAVIREAAKGV